MKADNRRLGRRRKFRGGLPVPLESQIRRGEENQPGTTGQTTETVEPGKAKKVQVVKTDLESSLKDFGLDVETDIGTALEHLRQDGTRGS